MLCSVIVAAASLASLAIAQRVGHQTPEEAPPLTYELCTTRHGCATQHASVVLDAASRSIHTASGESCDPDGFNKTICSDEVACAHNCYVEGVTLADYDKKFGTKTQGSQLDLYFGTGGQRLYLLDKEDKYVNFKVLNQEFTFDVDIHNVPCGYNAALYFSEMDVDGGLGRLNQAGAKYGTGYCDSQCGTGTYFFDDHVNWNGTLGTCCNEMDIWEANFESTQLTPHPCHAVGTVACTGAECADICDPRGCDYNPYRLGHHTFYGPDNTVNTNETFTVVTQFITNDGTAHGELTEIRRIYVQNGVVIQNAVVALDGLPAINYINQELCTEKIELLGDASSFDTFGGLKVMGESLARGAVLVFSLWDDLGSGMDWLDGLGSANASAPGAFRGNCTDAEAVFDGDSSVVFSNIKVGDLNSTFTQKHHY